MSVLYIQSNPPVLSFSWFPRIHEMSSGDNLRQHRNQFRLVKPGRALPLPSFRTMFENILSPTKDGLN